MTNTQHTPGPWRIEQPHNAEVATVYMDKVNGATAYGDNAAANARLIRAAPKLYEALRHIVEQSDDNLNPWARIHMAADIEPARALLARINQKGDTP